MGRTGLLGTNGLKCLTVFAPSTAAEILGDARYRPTYGETWELGVLIHAGPIRHFVRPEMLRRFGAEAMESEMSTLCNGAFIGLHTGSETARAILREWRACSLDLECIAPGNSTRRDHRQDQAALTVSDTRVEERARGRSCRSSCTLRARRCRARVRFSPVLHT